MSKEKSVYIKLKGDAKRGSMNILAAKRRVVVGLTFLLIGTSASYAQVPLIWRGTGTSSWFTTTNWNPTALPATGQTATIANGATAQIAAPGALIGALTIDGGSTLLLSSGGNLGVSVSLTVGTAGTLTFSGGALTVAGTNVVDNGSVQFAAGSSSAATASFSGFGNLVVAGTLTANSNSTYTGGTTISSGGRLNLGSGGNVGSIVGPVVDDGLLVFNRGNAVAFAGAISGAGGLEKQGAETLTLSGVNTYAGATTITAGRILAGSVNGLSPNSAFTVNLNTTLDLNGFNNTIGSLSGAGSVINDGSALAALTVANDNTTTTFSGIIQDGIFGNQAGVLHLTKSGTGTLILTGANSYTGNTTINAGTLQVGNGGATGSILGDVLDNGILAFNPSNALAFTFAGAISVH
jgi:fibronectin-binding autotransporter adhesin